MDDEGRPQRDKWGRVEQSDFVVPVVKLQHTLADVARNYTFFTPALMLQAGGFDRDPVSLAAVVLKREADIKAYDCPIDIFKDINFGPLPTPKGVEMINWNRRLYFVHNEHWPAVRNYILSIGWMHPERGLFTTVLTVVDIFMQRPAQKVLSISCFQPKHNNQICVLQCTGLSDVYPRPVWRAVDSFGQRSLIYDKKSGENNAN